MVLLVLDQVLSVRLWANMLSLCLDKEEKTFYFTMGSAHFVMVI